MYYHKPQIWEENSAALLPEEEELICQGEHSKYNSKLTRKGMRETSNSAMGSPSNLGYQWHGVSDTACRILMGFPVKEGTYERQNKPFSYILLGNSVCVQRGSERTKNKVKAKTEFEYG